MELTLIKKFRDAKNVVKNLFELEPLIYLIFLHLKIQFTHFFFIILADQQVLTLRPCQGLKYVKTNMLDI